MSDSLHTFVPPAADNHPTAGTAARVAAYFGGICILVVATVISLGSALVAPLGMLVVAKVQRSRGRILSVLGHWLTAVGSVMILFALLGTVGASVIPKASFEKFRRESDSISAKQPPPAWIERMAPGTSQRIAEQKRKPPSATAQNVGMAFGAAFVVILFGLIFGSIGWVGGALIAVGVKGRWPGSDASSAPA